MVSLFRHHVSIATLVQLLLEGCLFFLAVLAAAGLHRDGGMPVASESLLAPAAAFALVMVCVNAALGLYRRDAPLALRALAGRALAAVGRGLRGRLCGVRVLSAGGRAPRDAVGGRGLRLRRRPHRAPRARDAAVRRAVPASRAGGRRRPEAAAIEQSIKELHQPNVRLVGFYPVAGVDQRAAVAMRRVLPSEWNIGDAVRRLDVDEVVVAVREQRGGTLPLAELLDCRVAGVRVTDLSVFFERARGEVPVESLKASWLIYGDGFKQGWGRSAVKRAFDLTAAAVLRARRTDNARGDARDPHRERRAVHLPSGARRPRPASCTMLRNSTA